MSIGKQRKTNKGITLIALVITIIILLILAGISISVLIGENGLLKKVNIAKESTKQEEGREIIKLAIEEMRIEKAEKGENLSLEYIGEHLHEKLEIEKEKVIPKGEPVESIDVIYGDFVYNIDGSYQVAVNSNDNRPEVEIIILDQETNSKKVRIQVKAKIKKGQVTAIESMNGLPIVSETEIADKIFETTKNGNFQFKITDSFGRETIVSTRITNIQEEVKSLLKGIEKVVYEGEQEIILPEKANYKVNVILHKGDLILDGNQEVKGATLINKTYEFGEASDVATEKEYAKNTVVLKVEGNLTIQEGITVTTVKSEEGYGGPKGLVVYCTGTLNNYGTISMTARGAKSPGEDIYLWENLDGSYEIVPAIGAEGGEGVTNGYVNNTEKAKGNIGKNGTNRKTGGGGSGAAYHGDGSGYATTLRGGNGTSYSGGTGSGAINENCYTGPTYGRAGSDEGGTRWCWQSV